MRTMNELPVLAADLTWVKVNGGRSYGHLANWDEDEPPVVGQRVLATDGRSERLEAVITEIRDDERIMLSFPAFENRLSATG